MTPVPDKERIQNKAALERITALGRELEESKMNFFKWMTSQLKCPVYYGYPYGHEPGIRALDFQRKAVIKNGVVTFEK